jgi:hypothetical protein
MAGTEGQVEITAILPLAREVLRFGAGQTSRWQPAAAAASNTNDLLYGEIFAAACR